MFSSIDSIRIGSILLLLFMQQIALGDSSLLQINNQIEHENSDTSTQNATNCEMNFGHHLIGNSDLEFSSSLKLNGQYETTIDLAIELNMAADFIFLNWQCHQAEQDLWQTTHQTTTNWDSNSLSLEHEFATQHIATRSDWRPSPKWKVSLISQDEYDDYPAASSPKDIVSYSEDDRQGAYLQFSWLY